MRYGLIAIVVLAVGMGGVRADEPAGEKAERQRKQLKEFGLAMHNYESAYSYFPTAATLSQDGKPLLSWRVSVLPFLGEKEAQLYKQFKLDEPWDSPANAKLIPLMPTQYAVTADKPGMTRVQLFVGKGSLFEPGAKRGVQFITTSDGTSNTLMVCLAAEPVEWTKPADMPFDAQSDPRKQLLFEAGVTPVVLGDGSVPNAYQSASLESWRAAITRAGGEKEPPITKPVGK